MKVTMIREPGIQGIILAGTHRWDEFSFDDILPRSLAPVGHWPLISFVVKWFQRAGIPSATICANSTCPLVRQGLGDGSSFGMKLDYYEDAVPRGPAGCVRDAGLNSDADIFLIADATTIPWLDPGDLLESHRRSGAAMTAVVSHEALNRDTTGIGLTPAGIYVCERSVLDFIRETGYQDIKEILIPHLYESGYKVKGYVSEEPCLRVTDAWSYLAVNEKVLQRISELGSELPGYTRLGEGYVHRTAQYPANVNFIGPVLVGPGTRIGREVTILGPMVIGGECEIGKGTTLGRGVFWDQCTIGEHCRIDRCLLTAGASIPSRTELTRVIHRSVGRRKMSLMSRLASRLNRMFISTEPAQGNGVPGAPSIYLGHHRSSQAEPGRAMGTTFL